MNTTVSAEQQLDRNKIVARFIDYAMVGTLALILVIAIFWCLHQLQGDPAVFLTKLSASIIVGLIYTVPAIAILGWVGRAAMARFAPTWVIDASDPLVVKVKGSLPLTEFEYIEAKMLKTREGYRSVDDAPKRFGCALAAVPIDAH